MMEETLIRENANRKSAARNYTEAPVITKPVGPPVTFINKTRQTEDQANSNESIFSFGEDKKNEGEENTAAESGESNESGKSD